MTPKICIALSLFVTPLAFVTHTVSHFPHHFGQVTFAGTIKEALGYIMRGAAKAGDNVNANALVATMKATTCSLLPVCSSFGFLFPDRSELIAPCAADHALDEPPGGRRRRA